MNSDPSLVAKVESAKKPAILEELIELTSTKDPKCWPNNSTMLSDPYLTFDSTTTIHLAHLLSSYRQQHIHWWKPVQSITMSESRPIL